MLLCFGLLLTGWRLRVDFTAHPHARSSTHGALSSAPRTALPQALTIRRSAPSAVLPAVLPAAGPPSLDATLVNQILGAYHSPLQGHGAQIVALSVRYGIDDAVALGFFAMESRIGTQGEAVATHSVGNMRPMPNAPSLDGYRSYPTWMAGVEEWFRVIHSLYFQSLQLTSVEAIVPVYAPASDSNDPLTMIAGIRQLVACWRGQTASCPADPPGVPAIVSRAWSTPIALPLRAPTARLEGPTLPRLSR